MKNPKKVSLTIFTPTYNRASTLPRVFDSLESQTLKNFEWLIIDDGSTDDTFEVVNSFYRKASFPIRYVKQENAGKQAAWNKAVRIAKGEYFCGLDSDDSLYNDKVIANIFSKYINNLDDSNVIGLRCLAFSTKNQIYSAQPYDEEVKLQSWFHEIKDNKIGDRNDVWKLKILKNHLYPVRSYIKFIPEIWLYSILSSQGYIFAYINQPTILIYDQHNIDRLSKSSLAKNAEGQYIARSAVLKNIPLKYYLYNPLYFIKNFIRFAQTANYLGKSFSTRSSDTNLIVSILSFIIYVKAVDK